MHIHTYFGKGNAARTDYPLSKDESAPGEVTLPLNEPAGLAPSVDPNPEHEFGQKGTDETREELGGKEMAGPPSGQDKGALERGGEAGGTHTSPGPSVEQVEEWKRSNGQAQNGEGNGQVHAFRAQVVPPGVNGAEHGEGQVIEVPRMEPHLQLMYVNIPIEVPYSTCPVNIRPGQG